MSSSDTPSISAPTRRFPFARLTVIPANKHEKPRCFVRLAVSHRLYWKVVDNEKAPAPTSLFDFSNQSSLAFERLTSNATWEDVRKKAAPHGEDGLSFMVYGRLYGRARRTTLSREVSIILTACKTAERNMLMNEIRLRISPPVVLQQHAKKLMYEDGTDTTFLADLVDEMKSLFVGDIPGQHVDEMSVTPSELGNVVSSDSARTMKRAKRIDSAISGVDWVEKINASLNSWISLVALPVKKCAGASETVADIAQNVADYAKIIPVG